MIEGVKIRELTKILDKRGLVAEIFREDWKELVGKDRIMQSNLSVLNPNVIKAWHRHAKGQVDYFIVIQGTIRLCVYDEKTKQLDEIILAGLPHGTLKIVRVPGRYWHGLKNIASNQAVYLYFVTKLYDYKHPDEERKDWDSKSIPYEWNEHTRNLHHDWYGSEDQLA
jgi:dTDP-4-dehydrorhamnose 3,5-epimerase